MDKHLKRNLTAGETWERGLFMLLFLVIYSLAEILWFAVALFQFVHSLVSGATDPDARRFARNLCAFQYAVLSYVAFAADERPWPFAPWPDLPDDRAVPRGTKREARPRHTVDRYEPGDETIEGDDPADRQ